MKKVPFLLSLAVSIQMAAALPAFASDPLLTKYSGSGFTPPEYSRSERCDVFADKVIVSLTFADVQMIEVRPVAISGDMKQLLARAMLEPVRRTPNFLCDGPSTSTVIPKTEESGESLFQTGGCGSDSLMREGPASLALRAMIDTYCPTTFQPPQN